MISSRTILRRTLHTTSRLRVQHQFEKGGDEVGSSVTAGGKTYVVSEPVENEKPFGVPAGVYSSGEPLRGDAAKASSCALPPSSTSASPAHPTLSKQAQNDKLAERNAWPSEKQGRMGRDEAAKHRK